VTGGPGGRAGVDPGRVAEVLVTLDGTGPGRRGSGYRVSGTAVLTAAHVVRGASRVQVRFDADQPGEWMTDAEVSWADDGVDAAVLTLAGGAAGEGPVAEAGFGRVADADAVLTCSAVGFPRFKLRQDPAGPGDDSPSQYRDSVHAVGTVAVLSNRREGTLEVIVAPPERDDDPDRSPWEGMSGAAVWSAGQVIGVVTEHHRSDGLGRLAASRVDRWSSKLAPEQGGALRRLLPWLPVTPSELTEVVPATEAERLQAGYLAQVRDIAPVELIGREAELAALVEFCAGPDPYAWWQAGPWAGKSALAAWFVLHPPAGTVVASFFVTSRLTGQADIDAFTEAMIEQLAAIAGEPVAGQATPAGRDRERRRLLEAAAARVAARQQRLVLVIDGLDEDVGATAGSSLPSIAALLPRNPHDAVRILVTSRPHPGIPDDVPAGHPIRLCDRYQLATSSLAQDIQYEAKSELTARLHGDPLQLDVIGFITAAGGGLTLGELAELTGERYWSLKGKLGSVFGRSLLTRQSYDPPAEDPEDRVYLFAHETLRATAEQELAYDLGPYRERLHVWADDYRSQDWPEATPRYLLRPYGRMLAASQDLARLVQAATDTARQDRMLAQTYGDAAALAEINAARQLYLAQDSPDLMALARLAISQDRLENRNRSVPPELISLWARLGQTHRAEALARSFHEPTSQARALSAMAAALAQSDPDHAKGLAAEARQLADQAPDSQARASALRSVALNAAQAGFWEIADLAARSVRDPADRADLLSVLAGHTGIRPELAASLAAEALAAAASLAAEARAGAQAAPEGYNRDQVLRGMVNHLIAAGLWDQAEQAAGWPESADSQAAAQCAVVDGLLGAGRWGHAERTARRISRADWRAHALATVSLQVAGDDPDRARSLAMEAEQATRTSPSFPEGNTRAEEALAVVARAFSQTDPGRAAALAAELEGIARERSWPENTALLSAAQVWAVTDQNRALALAAEVLQRGSEIREPRGRTMFFMGMATRLAGSGMWELAGQALQAIPDADGRDSAQYEVAAMLGQAGHLDEAMDAALSLGDPDKRARAVRRAVRGLAEAGLWARAEQAARDLDDEGQRGLAYRSVVEGLLRAGLTLDAERAARSAETAGYIRALMLAMAGTVSAGSDQPRAVALAAAAEQIARAPRGSLNQVRALAAASGVSVAGDRPRALSLAAEAERTARALPAGADQSQGLSLVAAALTTLDPARAQRLAAAATGLAERIPGPHDQAMALRQISQALLAVGLRDEAALAARAARDPGERATTLAMSAVALSGSDPSAAAPWADEAIQSARLIPGPTVRSGLLSTLAGQLAAGGLWEHADQAAWSIYDYFADLDPDLRLQVRVRLGVLATRSRDPAERDRARPGLAAAMVETALQDYVSAGDAEKLEALTALLAAANTDRASAAAAEQAARAPSTPACQAIALAAVGVLVSAADPARSAALATEAVAVAGTVTNLYERSWVLPALAAGLGAAGRWEQARQAALAVPSRHEQARALHDLVAGLIADRRWDEATAAARVIEDPREQAGAVHDIVSGLSGDRLWDRAEEAAQAMANPAEQALAYDTILTGLSAVIQASAACGPSHDAGADGVRSRARRLAAAVLASTHWPRAIKPIGVLFPADAAAIGDVLVRAPGG